jgi:hypothetical protein
MTARRNAQQPAPQDAAPPPAQTPPPSLGYGHPEFHFVTGLLAVQKQLGEINANLILLTKTVDSTKSKVEDLLAWKNRILGGAVVVGLACTLIGLAVTKFSSYFMLKPDTPAPTVQVAPPQVDAQPLAPPAAPRPKPKH